MTRMSLGEKIGIFFNVVLKNHFSILILLFLIVLAYMFITTNKKNVNTTKKAYIISYTGIVVFILVAFSTHIFKFLDYMMNNFFIAVYFPNLAIYFAAIIISNIILVISIFRPDINRTIKNINVVVYTIITFIFILLIGVISEKNLDVYSQASVYANRSAHALIEITSTIFVLWIIFLSLYYLIRRYQEKQLAKNTKIKRKKIPTNLVEIKLPEFAFKSKPKETEISKVDIDKIVNEKVNKLIQSRINESKELDGLFTKNDYIVLLELLKEKKKQQDKEKQVIKDDQESYIKLQELYKSVK